MSNEVEVSGGRLQVLGDRGECELFAFSLMSSPRPVLSEVEVRRGSPFLLKGLCFLHK